MGSVVVEGLFSIGLLIISEAVINVGESLSAVLESCWEFAECVFMFSIACKSQIPYGVNVFWIGVVCSLGETELELEPAEVGFGAFFGGRRNMSLIFLIREVLLPDAALELVSGEFTVAAFRFVVVVAFDLTESFEFDVKVLMKRDQSCLCHED